MSRYLVQSGSFRMTVQADDTHKAALWAIHQSLGQVLPAEGPVSGTESSDAGSRPEAVDAPAGHIGRLGRRMRVMRDDGVEAESLDTYAVMLEWSQLLVALDRIESALDEVEAEVEPVAEDTHPSLHPAIPPAILPMRASVPSSNGICVRNALPPRRHATTTPPRLLGR